MTDNHIQIIKSISYTQKRSHWKTKENLIVLYSHVFLYSNVLFCPKYVYYIEIKKSNQFSLPILFNNCFNHNLQSFGELCIQYTASEKKSELFMICKYVSVYVFFTYHFIGSFFFSMSM